MKKNRIIKITMLFLAMLFPTRVMAATTEVNIPVRIAIITKEVPTLMTQEKMKNLTADVEITAEDNAPLPEKTSITLNGDVSGNLGPIIFDEPGEYKYTVSQKIREVSDFKYDETVYGIIVQVFSDEEGYLKGTAFSYKKGDSQKTEGVVFENHYNNTWDETINGTVYNPESETDEYDTKRSKPKNNQDAGTAYSDGNPSDSYPPGSVANPQTGDDNLNNLPMVLALITVLLVSGLLLIKKKSRDLR